MRSSAFSEGLANLLVPANTLARDVIAFSFAALDRSKICSIYFSA